jgi:hypothetical protein
VRDLLLHASSHPAATRRGTRMHTHLKQRVCVSVCVWGGCGRVCGGVYGSVCGGGGRCVCMGDEQGKRALDSSPGC